MLRQRGVWGLVLLASASVILSSVPSIETIGSTQSSETEVNRNELDRETILAQIEQEWALAWRREAYNRHAMIVIEFLTWISAFLLLGLTSAQVSAFARKPAPLWFRVLLACVALLAVTLPQLNAVCRFRQKQEVNDILAREYGVLRTKLLSNAISLEEAVSEYEELTKTSPEALSRETP